MRGQLSCPGQERANIQITLRGAESMSDFVPEHFEGSGVPDAPVGESVAERFEQVGKWAVRLDEGLAYLLLLGNRDRVQ